MNTQFYIKTPVHHTTKESGQYKQYVADQWRKFADVRFVVTSTDSLAIIFTDHRLYRLVGTSTLANGMLVLEMKFEGVLGKK
ncbi:hypothetical protein [Persicobacter psychrovividus]